ncbi:MAG: hypothetical protein EOO08_15010 [Chitinophagaceae bacterium]|nr:MAG: hypothetical protein EOO08_15010 [Chitinophagaceae bacterium]
MKQLLFSALCGLAAFAASAQSARRVQYEINPGETIGSVLKFTDIFKYPAFKQGTVFFKNGAATNGLLNYSYLAGAVQFINEKGDTLSLTNEEQVALVAIETDSFYYNKAYLELVARLPEGGGVYKKEFLRVASVRKIGLYDQPVDGGSVDNVGLLQNGTQDRFLPLRQKTTLVRERFLYITDKYEHLVLVASRKNLEKLYPKRHAAISTYLASNKVDFQNVQQVQGLIAYLQQHS